MEFDWSTIHTMEEFHDRVWEQINGQCPYYGRNLDALYDFLTSLSCNTIIYLHSFERAKQSLDKDAAKLEAMLRDAADENPCLRLQFD